jgi:hypothetical protein
MEINLNFWISLGISALYGGILYVYYKIGFKKQNKDIFAFAKNVLVWVVLPGGFLLYLVGYTIAHDNVFSITNVWLSLYSTARLLILGNDLVEIKEIFLNNAGTMKMFVELLHLGISLIMGTVVFVFFIIFIRVITASKHDRIRLRKSNAENNYIFFGVNQASISLAKDILINEERAQKSLVIFIETEISEDEKNMLNPILKMGAIMIGKESFIDKLVLKNEEMMMNLQRESHADNKTSTSYGDFLSSPRIVKCILKRKSHFFFFLEDEELNIRHAENIMQELNELSIKEGENKDFVLYVRTLAQDYLEDGYDQIILERNSIEVRYLNDTLIAARKLVKDNSPVDFVRPNIKKAIAQDDFTPLIIGFGGIGQSVLRKLVEMGNFLGNEFRAIIVDENMNKIVGRFENRFPGLSKNYTLEFKNQSTGEKSFYENLINQPEFLKYVVISLGNDETNTLLAIEIKNLAKRLNVPYTIFIHLDDENRYDILLENKKKSDPNLIVFGRTASIFNYNDIIDNTLYNKAKRIHEIYTSHSDTNRRQKEWNDLERIKQLSNISVMEHLPIKCKLIGLSKHDIVEFESEAKFAESLGSDRLENMAIGEHLRWNAQYFANGWDTLPLAEIGKDNKVNERRLHGCLVDWDKLDEVEKRSYEVKIYDRLNIKGMWEQIRESEKLELKDQERN